MFCLIKQNKTAVKPPYDPTPYEVIQVKGTKITAKRGKGERTRNVDKVKVLRNRPDYLRQADGNPRQALQTVQMTVFWRRSRATQDPPPLAQGLPTALPPPPPPRYLRKQWIVNKELQARTVRVIAAHTSQQHKAAENTMGRKTKQPEKRSMAISKMKSTR